jgi:hypothetical protein
MDIWNINALVLFIAFVIPGFISLKSYHLLFPGEFKSSDKLLVDAIAYSSINYGILFWPIYEIEYHGVRELHPAIYGAFYVFTLLVAPVVWVVALKWVRTRQFAQKFMPHPIESPWDFVFQQRKPYWVLVTLKDGRAVGGRYDHESFASSAPAPEELYLQEAWALNDDGGLERPRRETAGILIRPSEIVTVEFFAIRYGESNEREEREHRGVPATQEGVPAKDDTNIQPTR